MNTRVAQEFTKHAESYNRHNIIQTQVAAKLISMLEQPFYKAILDLGCGSGALYQNLLHSRREFEHMSVFDISDTMLELHPADNGVIKIKEDFNKNDFTKSLPLSRYDVVLSSSALQWSNDIDATIAQIAMLSESFYFAIFTSDTFKTLHKIANIASPILAQTKLKRALQKSFYCEFETVEYQLQFESTESMLRYIKQSGVSGGERVLGLKQTKKLLQSYPLDYLEFEVLFVKAKSKQ